MHNKKYSTILYKMSSTEEQKTFVNRTVILNSTNIVPNTNNSRLNYRFNDAINLKKGDKISLASMSIYKSWFNVNANLYNNHLISYKWFNSSGNLSDVFNITIPDGFYSITTLQLFLESEFFKRGHYLANVVSGLNEYFITLRANEVQYAIQLYISAVPNTLLDGTETKYIKTGTWSLPSVATCPQLIVSSMSKIGALIGFSAGTYPPTTVTNSNYSVIGDIVPQINPISGILMKCSLVSNSIMNPSDILYQFSDSGIEFGGLINVDPNNLLYVNVSEGWVQQISIELVDQLLGPIHIKDPSMVIMLSILTQN